VVVVGTGTSTVEGSSSAVLSAGPPATSTGLITGASSPVRPRKRAANWLSTEGESASAGTTSLATTATPTAVDPHHDKLTSSPNSIGLKQHLHRLSIHSPGGATANSSVSRCEDPAGSAYPSYDGFLQRFSTPLSFAKTSSTTPPTLDSPSSCFSKVVVTSTTTPISALSPRLHHNQHQHHQRRSNSTGGATTPAPSPRIVPLTVLTHDVDDDCKLPPFLRSSPGRPTNSTRVFLPRSPPEVRSVWSMHDNNNNDPPDELSPFLPRTPNSGISWSTPAGSSSRQRHPALPKITLTPRSLAKRAPVIPRFPVAEDNDDYDDDIDDIDEARQHQYHDDIGPITVASFPRRKPTPSDLGYSPRVSASIFYPPTAQEVNDSFQQLQERQQQQQQHDGGIMDGRPTDDMESLSDNDGEGDAFLLAVPSILAEEKLQNQQRFRNVKARKSSEELFVLGDKQCSMTSLASSSYASLRGIAYAPSDPDLFAFHGISTDPPYGANDPHHPHQQSQDSLIGWTFDADEHYVPARDLVTPPIISTSSSGGTHLPPLLPTAQRLVAATTSTTTSHPIESPPTSMSNE
jgi:hypothetical protein